MGGVEQVIKNITLETRKLGVEQQVLALNKNSQRMHYAGAEIHYFYENFSYASCPFSLSLWHRFKQLTAWADLIHYHYPWPSADFMHLTCRIKKPFIVTYHADVLKAQWQKFLYTPIQNAFLERAKKIIATSQNLLTTSTVLKKFNNKSTVIPLGINPEDYPTAQPEVYKKWQTQLGQDFILFVGVLRQYKGLPYLLEAAAQTKVPLVIAGQGPLYQELQTNIQANNLNHVHLIGAITEADKVALLQLCRAVILPSQTRAEAFGICLLEGALFKKPLISTELGTGTSFVNQDQKTGLVVAPKNAQALAHAMNTLYQNPLLAEEYGTQAFQWFMNNFTSATMGERYLQVYEKILERL
jgi:rhamnosyl/mannosyltransferase